jgi:hypothetical protein
MVMVMVTLENRTEEFKFRPECGSTRSLVDFLFFKNIREKPDTAIIALMCEHQEPDGSITYHEVHTTLPELKRQVALYPEARPVWAYTQAQEEFMASLIEEAKHFL